VKVFTGKWTKKNDHVVSSTGYLILSRESPYNRTWEFGKPPSVSR